MKPHTIVRLVCRRALKLAALGAALLVMLISDGRDLTAQAAPDWVCFPTCSTTDAKMLTMSGQAVSSLAGQEMLLALSAAPDSPSIIVSFFDGETGGNWDTATASPLMFELYADPLGNGAGVTGTPLVTWVGATMANNAWSDMPPVPNPGAAQACAGCAFKYALRVYPTLALGGIGTTNFKIRTNGIVGLRPQEFGFLAPIAGLADARIVYPALPALTPTTYDGVWSFAFAVPSGGTNRITLWDGDFDWGPWDCSAKDTDDPDSPPFPPFTVTSATLAETNAGQTAGFGTHICTDGTRSSGNPSDDWNTGNFRRTPVGTLGPNSYYTVTAPDGKVYANLEPSGNSEWEQFTIDADPSTAFDRSQMDVKAAKLPGGVYTVKVDGMDLGNLNFWRFQYTALGRTQDDKPTPEDAFYKIGRYVWYDTNENGIPDVGEPPIANVGITVTDEDGSMQFATTNAVGEFYFRVPKGRFTVVVDADNFLAGKPLKGLASTTGGETESVEVGPSPLQPYAEAIFGYIEKKGGKPPVAGDDTAAVLCGTNVTINILGNDSDPDNDALTVTAVSPAAHGTAVLNGDGTVTYAPAVGFVGTDSFTYTIDDGTGGTATGTVKVDATNQPAVALDDSASTQSNTPVTVKVLANDSDPDGSPLAVVSAGNGAHGTTLVNADGTITYTPAVGFWGTDSFTYAISDGCGTAAATVTITVLPPPVCYVGSKNPTISANQSWVANPDGETFTLRTTLSKSFNDNTYGANTIGWPGGGGAGNHRFSHLVTSDMVQLALYDTAGARKLEFRLDYLSAVTGAEPSGYASLGTWGGDGGMVFGDGSAIVAADSSLAANFRQGPAYWLTVDSPATDANYTPNPTYPNWIFEAWYEVTVKKSAFGAQGFGQPRITAIHASPSKSGTETEPLKVVDCEGNVSYPTGSEGTAAGTGLRVRGGGNK